MAEKSTTTYVFHNVDKACAAAIEYVIFKYGDKLWFNANLNKVVTDTLIKSYTELCTISFIIIRTENDKTQLSYKGYHYIIDQIEKYNNITYINNINILIYKYSLIFSIIMIIGIIILIVAKIT